MASDSNPLLALSLAEQTWREFYAWERQSAGELLSRLNPDVDSLSSSEDSLACSVDIWTDVEPQEAEQALQNRHDEGRVQTFDGEACVTTSYSSAVFRCATIRPGPQYTSCDQLSRRIFLGQGDQRTRPRALPFADDPSFDTEKYLLRLAGATIYEIPAEEQHRLLEQLKLRGGPGDPNLDAIELEILRRLHNSGISFPETQHTSVLSRNTAHIVLHCWQRVLPPWPCLDQSGSQLRDLAASVISGVGGVTLREHFCAFMEESCFRLPCLESSCISHPPSCEPHLRDRPVPSLATPDPPTSNPCGRQCYLSSSSLGESENLPWDEGDLDSLALIVGQCPKLNVCQLAVAMDRPCHKIFVQRRDLPNRRPELFRPLPLQEVALQEDNDDTDSPCISLGCSHTGPCNLGVDCACAKFSHYCQTACSCSRECERRYPGCNCHTISSLAVCHDPESCLCLRLSRECEPGVCQGCLQQNGHKKCVNRVLSGAARVKYKVAESNHGYGLFAKEKIMAKELIGEYIGELLCPERTDAQAAIAEHVGRNYLYDWLNEEVIFLDSFDAGNAMRFINHVDGRKSNAKPSYKWVDGDFKLAIYATRKISKNQEILMSYGKLYFFEDTVQEYEDPEDGRAVSRIIH
ncbi:SET domain-containing protein [Auricularia subglabra TFB-10046 SS5]|nr:SET domain-containing protein [Auricularia subglabra TFB-10046 SS5]